MYRVCVFPAAISVFFFLLFPLHSQAQIAPGGAPGGFYSNSKLEPIDNSSLAVQVRAPNGSTLDTLAVVTLCNLSGQTITSKTTFGSQAVFTPLNKGQYTINVEAADTADPEDEEEAGMNARKQKSKAARA